MGLPSLGLQMSYSDSASRPIVVDLDGTLTKTDLLLETVSRFLIEHPFQFFKLFIWLAKGRPYFKLRLAETNNIDASFLPYNSQLITWLREEKDMGRRIVLATASNLLLAQKVATHIDLFDSILASDGTANLKGDAKCKELVNLYGVGGFEYVGNDWVDLAIWPSAAKAHVVSNSSNLVKKVTKLSNFGKAFTCNASPMIFELFRTMRLHQWAKNILIFIPLLTSHQYTYFPSCLQALIAFLVFGLAASSVYVLNDIVDVVDDRHHASKRNRPLAAGTLSLFYGWLAWPLLLIIAITLGGSIGGLPKGFLLALVGYVSITMAYSLRLKQFPLVDVITLASLYTLRIIAGAAAISVQLSYWLLSFSMFFFLSLAFVKRYSELRNARHDGKTGLLRGRGYEAQDLEMVSSFGGSAGYSAVVVLALYIQDSHTAALYSTPTIIWLACPLMLFWISRVWFIAHRGNMHDDPIVFALKDYVSWFVIVLFATIFILAKIVQ